MEKQKGKNGNTPIPVAPHMMWVAPGINCPKDSASSLLKGALNSNG
ncbi:MAG: hypothetical protein KGZ75_08785 [Syntrophomonadaceae bacterium]|nr:hypothetical protein [Syntrophomonadaceae bacterium]